MENLTLFEIKNVLAQDNIQETSGFSVDALRKHDLIIYGCGSGFVTLSVFVLDRYGIIPIAVLDKKFTSQERKNRTLYSSPESFKPDEKILEHSIVVVTLGNPQIRGTIIKDLKKSGFHNVISAMDIYEYHLPNPDKQISLGGTFYRNNTEKILKAFGFFFDRESQEIFKQFLYTHIYRRCMVIPSRPLAEQYFPFDLWDKNAYRRSIICGAYNGDTAITMIKNVSCIDMLLCLEPDPANFDELKKNVQIYKNLIPHLRLLPLGVYDKCVQMKFSANKNSNSVISDVGDMLVQCIALDECLEDIAPTFISMDIEGAEMLALKGMKEIIKKNHPKLAISVYHSPEHLWEIPLFLRSLVPEYKFYLRNYTSFSSETVLYAY